MNQPTRVSHFRVKSGWLTVFYYARGVCRCGLRKVIVEGYWNNEDAAQRCVERDGVRCMAFFWQ